MTASGARYFGPDFGLSRYVLFKQGVDTARVLGLILQNECRGHGETYGVAQASLNVEGTR